VVDHLQDSGHEVMVLAPGAGPTTCGKGERTPVHRLPAVSLPVFRNLPVGLPTTAVAKHLEAFEPDVLHLAAPVIVGETAARAAQRLAVPAVAIYQTDLAGFARRYGLGVTSSLTWSWLRRVHNLADLTLAPSSAAEWDLTRHGISPVARWSRGVDVERWHPRQRSAALRRHLLGSRGRILVGYSGRLAPEKRLSLLEHLKGLPGVEVVVIGDGPSRASLERKLPWCRFLGYQSGDELARTVASLDVFVHTGPHETFCQAIQEALAAGVPVVAPASGGPLDLIQHGHNGWLYPAESPELMRPAVALLAGDPALRRTMGEAARASVAHRSWRAIGDELVGHYRRLARGTLSARRAA
jgi:phosphatidylinositol alpha 1,6-mannosyltransferase